jgi:hypothetical protein
MGTPLLERISAYSDNEAKLFFWQAEGRVFLQAK